MKLFISVSFLIFVSFIGKEIYSWSLSNGLTCNEFIYMRFKVHKSSSLYCFYRLKKSGNRLSFQIGNGPIYIYKIDGDSVEFISTAFP